MPQMSPLFSRFTASPIAQTMALAARLREDGRRLYDLSTGEPDFDTPEYIKEAAIAAIRRGETKYSPTDGSLALRAAVQGKFARENGLDFALEQIAVGSGAKPLLADILRTLVAEGDEVLLPAPYWPSHLGMIQLAGATSRVIATTQAEGFRLQPGSLAAALSPRSRVLILCAPSNPTGAIYRKEDLQALAEVLRRYPDLWILTDDLYEHIVFDGQRFHSLLAVAPDLADRVVVVNGVSKAYAMTGWRIGYAAGPHAMMAALRKTMSQSTGCPSAISEAAAIAALNGPLDSVQGFVRTYQARRDRALRALQQFAGVECRAPDGAFYLYPSCAGAIGQRRPDGRVIGNSADLVAYLLEDWSVAVIPGSAFGLDPYFRLSVAAADDVLHKGVARIGCALSALNPA